LIELRDKGLERSASRIDNRDFIGIDPLSKIVPSSVVGGAPGAAVGTVASIAGYPKIKAQNALRLYEMQKRGLLDMYSGTYNSGLMTGARQGILQSGRVGQEEGRRGILY